LITQIRSQLRRLVCLFVLGLALCGNIEIGRAEVTHKDVRGFTFELTVTLPGSPEHVFDLATGDISGWWDHHFSETLTALVIDPKPGGLFYETFGEGNDGVVHATVTMAERGKGLRMVGPLGLAGDAIEMVHTYTLTAIDETSTRLDLKVSGMGVYDEGIPEIVERVWRHFLIERFQPYAEQHAE